MSQPAIFENMNAVECQSLIFTLEDELDMLDIHYNASVKSGNSLKADFLFEKIQAIKAKIKEAEYHRDHRDI